MRAVSTDAAIKAISKLQHRSGFMDRRAWLASLESKIHSRWARATPGAVSGAASEAPDLISRTRLPDELRTWILEWPMKLIVWNWHPSEESTKIFPDTGFFYPFDVGRAGCFGSSKNLRFKLDDQDSNTKSNVNAWGIIVWDKLSFPNVSRLFMILSHDGTHKHGTIHSGFPLETGSINPCSLYAKSWNEW